MSDRSTIEWTASTWNPVRGCTKVSPGCKNCYAERFAERFRGVKGHPYEQGFDMRLVPDALDLPLRWKKPRRVFVNSMSDLFHEDVPDDFLDQAFSVMARAKRHTFQVLTKRAERMRRYMDGCARGADEVGGVFPWRNVWLGVSVEDRRSRARIGELERTPAALRFVSFEPLLENLGDLQLDGAGIGWAIVGGESGPGARPMKIPWAADIVAQCKAASVPVFVKQIGAVAARECGSYDRKGGDPLYWPPSLCVREFPEAKP